jgi:hypothetical protein
MVDVSVVRALPEFLNEVIFGFQKVNMGGLQFGQLGGMRLGRRPAVHADLFKLFKKDRLQGLTKARQLADTRKRCCSPNRRWFVCLCHGVYCRSEIFRDSRKSAPAPARWGSRRKGSVFQLSASLRPEA